MAINKKPNIDAFVAAAPDAAVTHQNTAKGQQAQAAGFEKGNRRQVSITFDPEVLIKIDNSAKKMGLPGRTAFITMACLKLMKEENL